MAHKRLLNDIEGATSTIHETLEVEELYDAEEARMEQFGPYADGMGGRRRPWLWRP
jgi:hypothetical protein